MSYVIEELGHASVVYDIDTWRKGGAAFYSQRREDSIVDLMQTISEAEINIESVRMVLVNPQHHEKCGGTILPGGFDKVYSLAIMDDSTVLPDYLWPLFENSQVNMIVNVVSKPAIKKFGERGYNSIWMPLMFFVPVRNLTFSNFDFDDEGRTHALAYRCSMAKNMRTEIIEPLINSNIPITIQHMAGRIATAKPRERFELYKSCLELYNSHLGTINMPRMSWGDMGQHFVHRIWHITLNKSCLFQYKVTTDSGFYELFTDGESAVIWEDVEDLIDKARYYIMDHPEKSIEIAKQAYQISSNLTTEYLRTCLINHIFEKEPLPRWCR